FTQKKKNSFSFPSGSFSEFKNFIEFFIKVSLKLLVSFKYNTVSSFSVLLFTPNLSTYGFPSHSLLISLFTGDFSHSPFSKELPQHSSFIRNFFSPFTIFIIFKFVSYSNLSFHLLSCKGLTLNGLLSYLIIFCSLAKTNVPKKPNLIGAPYRNRISFFSFSQVTSFVHPVYA